MRFSAARQFEDSEVRYQSIPLANGRSVAPSGRKDAHGVSRGYTALTSSQSRPNAVVLCLDDRPAISFGMIRRSHPGLSCTFLARVTEGNAGRYHSGN